MEALKVSSTPGARTAYFLSLLALFFAAALFLPATELGAPLPHYVKLYAGFLSFFLLWHILLELSRDVILLERKGAAALAERKKAYYLLTLMVLLILVPLVYLREFIASQLFTGMLIASSFGTLSAVCFQRNKPFLEMLFLLFYFVSVAYLNFAFFLGFYYWQPIFPAIAIGLTVLLAYGLQYPHDQIWKPLLSGPYFSFPLRPLLTLLAGFSIAFLVYAQELPKPYILPLLASIAAVLCTREKSEHEVPVVSWACVLFPSLFVLILVALRIFR